MHKLYSQYASPQKEIIDEAIPRILKLLDSMPTHPDVPFVIGDYGAADGGNSLLLLDKIIEHLKTKNGEDYAVSIMFEDQLANDFNCLFKILRENFQDQTVNKQKYKNIFCTATADDFFMQCVPRNTLNLVLCFTSLHWIPLNAVTPGRPSGKLIPVESYSVEHVAAKCWYDFLRCRSEELIPGGYAFLRVPCVRSQKANDIKTDQCTTYFSVMEKNWLALFQEGTISKEEHDGMVIPIYLRTERDLRLPFDDPARYNLPGRLELKLVSLRIEDATYSFYDKYTYQIANGELSLNDVVKAYAEFLKAFTFGTILSGLSKFRTSDEKQRIVDRFYQLICRYCMDHPRECVSDHIMATIILKKVPLSG